MKAGKIALTIAVLGCLTLAMAGSSAAAGIDRSFGSNGVVHLGPVPPGDLYGRSTDVATGPRGGIYLLAEVFQCSARFGCGNEVDTYISRLEADGSSDGSYGAGTGRVLVQSTGPHVESAFAVDSQERQLIVTTTQFGIQVVRLLPDGAFDPSFGTGGKDFFYCDCGEMQPYIETLPGDRIAVVAIRSPEPTGGRLGTVVQIRLSPLGWLDSQSIEGGFETTTLGTGVPGSEDYASAVKVLPTGATIIAGTSMLPNAKEVAFVERLDPRGQLDARFGIQAQRAINSVRARSSLIPEGVRMLIPRRGGELDLFGSVGGHLSPQQSYVLRLHADGRRDRKFGQRGFWLSRFLPFSGAADGRGHVLALAQMAGGQTGAVWFGREDRLNPPVFRLPSGSVRLMGTRVQMQGERPLIYDPHLSQCRSACVFDPRLVRLRAWGR